MFKKHLWPGTPSHPLLLLLLPVGASCTEMLTRHSAPRPVAPARWGRSWRVFERGGEIRAAALDLGRAFANLVTTYTRVYHP